MTWTVQAGCSSAYGRATIRENAMKILLAALGGNARDAVTLDCAAGLARRFSAHLVACHVRPDAASMVPMLGGEASGALVAEFMRIAEEEAAAQQKRARAAFDTWLKASGLAEAKAPGAEGPSVEWRQVVGISTETLPTLGRVSDLIVMARPEADSAGIHVVAIEAALFGSGRPVLLAPTRAGGTIGESVAVAWNGSLEASRAVAAALPVLKAARKVAVINVPDEAGTDLGADALVSYLAWHGIQAAPAPEAGAAGDIGPALVARATAASADLLVMGAYGHSRVRELVFGGATRHMVEDASIATLLVH
jgi:nucleotide-binding universal stress UspA family protein